MRSATAIASTHKAAREFCEKILTGAQKLDDPEFRADARKFNTDTRAALAAYETELDSKDCIRRRLDQAKQDGNRGGPRILRQDDPARFVPDSSAPVADAEAHDVATRDAIRRYKQDPGKEKLSNAKRYFDEAQKIMFKIEDDPQCRDAAVLDDALRKFEAARVDFEKLYKATEI